MMGGVLMFRGEASVRLKHFAWLGLCLLAVACKRDPGGTASTSSAESGGEPAAETTLWGHVNFHIDAIHDHQQPIEDFPGHADGGSWTFFDCTTVPGDAHFVVGMTVDAPPGMDPATSSRGRAIVRTADRASTDGFLAAFAQGFHTSVPEAQTPKPLRPLVFPMAIMGRSMTRAEGDVFTPGGGTWTVCKWTPTTPRLESEVFFDFNVETGEGQFVEKEPGLRENLMAVWARILRDGPRGQRTPQEDANVASSGPHLGELYQFAGAEGRDPFFVPGGKWLIYTAVSQNNTERVCAVETANPKDHRRVLAEFPQVVFQTLCNDPAGQRFVVEAKTPDIPDAVTPADPSRFWWIDAFNGTRKAIDGPWNPRSVDCDDQALSPDSRYLAVSESRSRADGKGGYTQLYVVDLQTFKAAMLDIDEQWCETLGWRGQGESLRLLVRTGLKFDAPDTRRLCLVDPASGDWQVTMPQDVALPVAGAIPSPDGQKMARIVERSRLEVYTGISVREMAFHADDRRFVDSQCVAWVDENYLSFYNPYPILIDTRSMKMNYALSGDWMPNNMRYSPDFKYAVLEFGDALVLAPVVGGQ
jgi:hypothetical protein